MLQFATCQNEDLRSIVNCVSARYTKHLSQTPAMRPPIIMTSFGTTSVAESTYTHLENGVRAILPGHDIYRAYSSREVRSLLQKNDRRPHHDLAELLLQLGDDGVPFAIVQSLHLLPGTEFHRLLHVTRKADLPCSIGMPLLTDPIDYVQFGEILQATVARYDSDAILLLGHGTTHPGWTAYYALEKILREQFGQKIFVGVVEHFPESTNLIERMTDAGFRSVCIIPLFLVAGMHYRRDIVGSDDTAWLPKLKKHGMMVSCVNHGVGLFPGIEELICRHIREARDRYLNIPR